MYDVAIVGAGLAGLVAAVTALDRGRRVIVLDQEPRVSLGGQAFWSLGGLFMVDTPEQRRMGIKDSLDLARQDWMGSAGFDRPEDYWPRKWAESYLHFAATEMRPWLHALGLRWFPVVGWAERGGSLADGHGNSVPRFHVTWGTGPGVIAPFVERVLAAEAEGKITLAFRHRVTGLLGDADGIDGVQGEILADSGVERGQKSTRDVVDEFTIRAKAVVIASGGIGGNIDLVRRNWPVDRLGPPPERMVCGVPDHVDGLMIDHTERAGAKVINRDRMWHYTEGIQNWNPIWPNHGIRILPGPSSIWFDADGNRLPAPCMPGFDTLATLKHLCQNGSDHSWFITTQKIIKKEFALSGSEQNPDLTGKDWRLLLKSRLGGAAPSPVEAFKQHGADFVVADTIEELVAGMRELGRPLEVDQIKGQIEARDRALDNPFSKDAQVNALRQARRYLGDKLIRTAKPHRILDPKAGPLIAVRLHILTRKSLGGIETDLRGNAMSHSGKPIPGLFACGEAAGFGGGGYHGYNALEGTFLGGCLFSGRAVGRAV